VYYYIQIQTPHILLNIQPLICIHVFLTTICRLLSCDVTVSSLSDDPWWFWCPVMVDGKNHSGMDINMMPAATNKYPSHQHPIHRASPDRDVVSTVHHAHRARLLCKLYLPMKYAVGCVGNCLPAVVERLAEVGCLAHVSLVVSAILSLAESAKTEVKYIEPIRPFFCFFLCLLVTLCFL